jgi:phospholipid/cholesterol/gamma-HCH transport system substrate-binding protein
VVVVDAIERPYRLTGDFAAAAGILPNAEVTYLGVHYGRVTDVDRTPRGVRVTMSIDRDRRIPADADAFILRKSAIGEPYIDFRLPDGVESDEEGAVYEAGDHVPMDRTSIPLEFSELLRSASRLIGAIDADDAGLLVHELALALDGRAGSLRTLTQANDELAATFAANTEMLDRLATNSTRLTHVVAQHRGSLGGSLTNLSQLSESLAAVDGDTRILLERGSRLMGTAADLVAGQKRNLDCLLHDLTGVVQQLNTGPRVDGLRTLLRIGPGAFAAFFSTRDVEPDGVWVRVNLMVDPAGQSADQYAPPRALPPVPGVPACAPTVAPPRAGDFDPREISADGGGTAALGLGDGLAGLVLVVAVVSRLIGPRPRRQPSE